MGYIYRTLGLPDFGEKFELTRSLTDLPKSGISIISDAQIAEVLQDGVMISTQQITGFGIRQYYAANWCMYVCNSNRKNKIDVTHLS